MDDFLLRIALCMIQRSVKHTCARGIPLHMALLCLDSGFARVSLCHSVCFQVAMLRTCKQKIQLHYFCHVLRSSWRCLRSRYAVSQPAHCAMMRAPFLALLQQYKYILIETGVARARWPDCCTPFMPVLLPCRVQRVAVSWHIKDPQISKLYQYIM